MDDDKNIRKFMLIRLLDFLLFHINRDDMQVLQKPREILVKKLFLIKPQA